MTHREFFDQSAAKWDEWENDETRARLRGIIAALNIAPEADVLDVGCGTGILFPLLCQAIGEQGHLVALDLSGEMLLRARAKGYRVAYVQGDAQALPLAHQVFDWVICNAVLPHFPDKPRALRELSGALRAGGTLVICHANSRQTINEIHRSVGGVIANDRIPDVEEMRELLQQAQLYPLTIQDTPDRYVVVARKIGF
jgi:ubiquinone/menaquinone biosynthesis C-methylase UbiE